MKTTEFAVLIEKLQNKDMSALKIIYEQFFQKIYYTAFAIVRNTNDAYDIAMDIIFKLVYYPSAPEKIKNHIGLLITMTKNESKDFLRRRKSNINIDLIEVITEKGTHDRLWFDDIISLLSEEEQALFIEHCIWGKRLKEIAKESDMAYITVKRIYAAIKSKIKKIYR